MMSRRKAPYPYQLDCGDITHLSDDEIVTILRAADPIIASGGRTLLAKILKGSKDKAVLTHGLEKNPSYGAFADKPIKIITSMIDFCIFDGLLRIEHEGRMPVLFFTERGWEIEKQVYANELLLEIMVGASTGSNDFIERMLKVNPQCVLLALRQIENVESPGLREALETWLPKAEGKVKKKLISLLSNR